VDLDVLGGPFVGQGDGLGEGVGEDDLPVPVPGLAGDLAGGISSIRLSISSTVRSATARSVETSQPTEVGPCSSWPAMSVARSSGSAVWSATTRISVGPASRSIPTLPKSWRLASAT